MTGKKFCLSSLLFVLIILLWFLPYILTGILRRGMGLDSTVVDVFYWIYVVLLIIYAIRTINLRKKGDMLVFDAALARGRFLWLAFLGMVLFMYAFLTAAINHPASGPPFSMSLGTAWVVYKGYLVLTAVVFLLAIIKSVVDFIKKRKGSV